MSVIAVRKSRVDGRWTIAADSIGAWNGLKRPNGTQKLRRIHDHMFMGGCGMSSINVLMADSLLNGPAKNTEGGWLQFAIEFRDRCQRVGLDSADNNFIVVWATKAWLINGLHVQEIEEYEAIGAGRAVALTALSLGLSAVEAVNKACDLCTDCMGPVRGMGTP